MSTLTHPTTLSPAASALLVTQARLRTLRTPAAKAGAWGALLAGCWALCVAAGIADTMRSFAESDLDVAATAFARAYLTQFATDTFASTASWVLAVVVSLTVAAPAVAPRSTRLLGGGDQVGLALARMTRFVDALISHASALTTIIALLAATALASLVTVDGQHRARALLVAWAAWATGVVAGASAAWVREILTPKARRLVVVALVASAAVGVLADPRGARSLFGAGEVVVAAMRTAPVWTVAATLALAAGGSWALGWWACQRASARPARPASARTVTARAMPTTLALALGAQLWRTIWRTPVVRTPVVLVALAGPVIALTASGPLALAAIVVTCPLMVALAFGVNTFSLTCGSAWWLASVPRAGALVARVHAGVIFAATTTCTLVPLTLVAVTGRAPVLEVGLAGLCAAASGAVYSAVCLATSVFAPACARPWQGEAIWPHARTVAFTLGALVVVGVPVGLGLGGEHLTGAAAAPGQVAGSAAGAFVLASGAVLALCGLWTRSEHVRSRVLGVHGR